MFYPSCHTYLEFDDDKPYMVFCYNMADRIVRVVEQALTKEQEGEDEQ